MSIKIRDATGTLRIINSVKVRDASGTLRVISNIKGRDATGTLRTLYTAGGGGVLIGTDVTVDTDTLYKSGSGTVSHGVVLSDLVTAVGHFGTPPYGYLWERYPVGNGDTGITITAPNAGPTRFTADVRSGSKKATYRCTVHDANFVYKSGPLVLVEFEWIDTR